MARYSDIREYVKTNHGFTPKDCWIAHMKEVCGIPVRVSPNRYSADKRVVPCPPDKMDAIKSAFIHFDMMPKTGG